MASTNILVYVESLGGNLKKPSLEALSEGRRLAAQSGGTIVAVILGKGARQLSAGLPGAASVFVEESDLFRSFHLSETADAVREAARERGDFGEADELREQLENSGYRVEDGPTGPVLTKTR